MTDGRFAVRGICYDAGVLYEKTFDSRPQWNDTEARRDFHAIRHELGCTAVLIMASTPERLRAAAQLAIEEDLEVWLQPRPFDEPTARVRTVVAESASIAQELREAGATVGMVVGCELTLSAKGMLPGPTFWTRGMLLPLTWWLLPSANARLRRLLDELVTLVRHRFDGPVSYGAGDWEQPDWSAFDLVGLDLYRDAHNRARFSHDLHARVSKEHAAGRRVMIFEFGSCAYRGAAAKASQAAGVLRGSGTRMRVPARLERDEHEQAQYLAELFDIFAHAGVDGTFVWGFSEPVLYRSTDDPQRDLDLASYGIVASHPDGGWKPKRAFYTVAAEYGGQPRKASP